MLALGFTESNLNYSVKHPTSDLSGIGGLKVYWRSACEGEGINPNSLQCIEHVYSEMLYTAKGNTYEAIRRYKGAKSNLISTDRYWRIYNSIKEKK